VLLKFLHSWQVYAANYTYVAVQYWLKLFCVVQIRSTNAYLSIFKDVRQLLSYIKETKPITMIVYLLNVINFVTSLSQMYWETNLISPAMTKNNENIIMIIQYSNHDTDFTDGTYTCFTISFATKCKKLIMLWNTLLYWPRPPPCWTSNNFTNKRHSSETDVDTVPYQVVLASALHTRYRSHWQDQHLLTVK